MNRYDATPDPLCYPRTSILMNMGGLTDQDQLDQFELQMFLSRAEEPLPDGELDPSHYCAIHRHFFQDVYDWAGQYRTIRTSKGGNLFCLPEYIPTEMDRLFAGLATEDHLASCRDADAFSRRAAHYLAELNAIHPFREGNGRCQLVLLDRLMTMSGFPMDEGRLEPERFMAAMVASFGGKTAALESAIRGMVR